MAESLRLVDPETGQLHERPKSVQDLEDENEGFRTTIRSQAGIIGNLKRDLRPEEDHHLFPEAKRLFDLWRLRCKHVHHKPQKPPGCAACTRIQFTADRFKQLLTHLREPPDGLGHEMCERAILGAAFDCYSDVRRNGSRIYYNGWSLIFRDRDKVEEFANKAPYHLPKPEHLAIVSKAILWRHPDWEYPQVTAEAKIRVRRWAV